MKALLEQLPPIGRWAVVVAVFMVGLLAVAVGLVCVLAVAVGSIAGSVSSITVEAQGMRDAVVRTQQAVGQLGSTVASARVALQDSPGAPQDSAAPVCPDPAVPDPEPKRGQPRRTSRTEIVGTQVVTVKATELQLTADRVVIAPVPPVPPVPPPASASWLVGLTSEINLLAKEAQSGSPTVSDRFQAIEDELSSAREAVAQARPAPPGDKPPPREAAPVLYGACLPEDEACATNKCEALVDAARDGVGFSKPVDLRDVRLDCAPCALRGLRFPAGSDLRGATFVGCDLSLASFDGVDLGGATFEGGDLSGATFRSSAMARVAFNAVETRDKWLSIAQPVDDDLAKLQILGPETWTRVALNAQSTDILGATFERVEFVAGSSFQRASASGATFRGVDLPKAVSLERMKWAVFDNCWNDKNSEPQGSAQVHVPELGEEERLVWRSPEEPNWLSEQAAMAWRWEPCVTPTSDEEDVEAEEGTEAPSGAPEPKAPDQDVSANEDA